MAIITLEELQAVRQDYSSLPKDVRPELASGQCPYREYKFAEAVKSNIYKVPVMNDGEIISVFNKIADPKYNSMSEKDLFDLVSIALNLRHPTRADVKVEDPWATDVLCSDFSTAKPSESNKVSMVGEERVKLTTIVPQSQNKPDQNAAAENQAIQAKAICYLFGWLTRFAVKSPSPTALHIQYGKIKDTFMKFYKDSSTAFDKFAPDPTWLISLRNAFDAFVRVKNTLVIYVASAETKYKTDPPMFNVMRFLFFQNLEFMGMHAYVSIVTIMNKVALPPSLVLTWLRMSGCELAVDEAYNIMRSLDNGMIPNGNAQERLWKYARMIDAGYFNKLQTAYAAGLVATLAYIEIYLGLSTETGYDSPLNIFAIANNRHIKEIGKAKAQAFVECKNSVISLSKDASAVDKIYAARAGKVQTSSPYENVNMDIEQETLKRPHETADADGSRKRKSPNITVPPPPPI